MRPRVSIRKDRLLWRMGTRRLDAEQIRDSMLFITGELDLKMGGPSVSGATPRRITYTKVIRNTRDPLLEAFDMAGRFVSVSDRNATTTPTQALLVINGPFGLARAKALAKVPSQLWDDFAQQSFYLKRTRAESSLQWLAPQRRSKRMKSMLRVSRSASRIPHFEP